jgi:hypothetical protein
VTPHRAVGRHILRFMDTKILLLIGAIVVIVGGVLLLSNSVARDDWILGTWEGGSPGTLTMAVAQYADAQGMHVGPYVSATDLDYGLTVEFIRDHTGHLTGRVTVVQHDPEHSGVVGDFTADAVIRGNTVTLDTQAETILPGSSLPVAKETLRLALTRNADELTGEGSLTYVFLDESGGETPVVDANGQPSLEGSSHTFHEIVLRQSPS